MSLPREWAAAESLREKENTQQIWLIPILISVGLIASNAYEPLLFHTLAELLTVCLAGITAFVGWQSQYFGRNPSILLLAGCYFWVGLLALIHTFSFQGIGILHLTASRSDALWNVARFVEVTALIIAPNFKSKKNRSLPLFLYPGLLTWVLAELVIDTVKPSALLSAVCLTILYLLAGIRWWRFRRKNQTIFRFVLAALFLDAFSELLIAVGNGDVLLLHVAKALSSWLIVEAVATVPLRRSLRELTRAASVYEAIPEPVLILDSTGRILQSNTAARRFAERNEVHGELVGQNCHAIFHAAGESEAQCEICQAVGTGESRCDYEYRVGEGTWHAISVSPLIQNNSFAMVHISHDISSRKKAEEMLLREQQGLLQAQELAGLGSWHWDLKNEHLIWSKYLHYLYRAPSEFHPSMEFTLNSIHAEDRDRVREIMVRLRTEGGESQTEYRIIRMDGVLRSVRTKVRALSADGTPVRLFGTVLDITDEMRARKELSERGEKYSILMEHVHDGIAIADSNERLVDFNPAFCRMLGYEEDELKRLTISALHPRDELDVVEHELRNLHYKSVLTERVVRRSDGSAFTAEIAASRIDYAGEPLYVGVFRDVTARKQAEQAIRDSERIYRTLVESLPEAVFLVNREAVYLSCNENYARPLGRGVQEIIGRRVQDVHPSSIAQCCVAADQQIFTSGIAEQCECSSGVQGEERLVRTIRIPVRDSDGEVIAVMGISWDITEDHRYETALRESREYLAQAEKLADMGSWAWTPGSSHMYWSEGLFRMLGRDPAVDEPTLKNFLSHVKSHDMHKTLETLKDSPHDKFEFEDVIWRLNGERRIVYCRLRVLMNSQGQVEKFIGTGFDITERKGIEEQLRLYRDELERLVEERTAKLRVAVRELESFSYTVSHDLHAPLRAINGYAHLIEQDLGPLLPELGRHYLERMLAATNRMGQLIDGLLMLSRVVRREPRPEAVDMTELAKELADEMKRAEPHRRVDVHIEQALYAVADRALLRLVLQNLLSNAWKFTRAQPEARVHIGREYLGRARCFFVRDNGIGFEMQYASKLFLPFHRLHEEESYDGMGIGLATVKRVIRHHGGKTWAESAPGQGTTIYFTLEPCEQPATNKQQEELDEPNRRNSVGGGQPG